MKIDYKEKRELYTILRNQIQHEDGLVNQRLTWMIVSQGFLFTAYFSTLNVLFDPQKSDWILNYIFLIALLYLIQFAGLALVLFSYRSIQGAFVAIIRIREFWYFHFPEEGLVMIENNPDYNVEVRNHRIISKQLPDITYRGDVDNYKDLKFTEKFETFRKSFWSTVKEMFNKAFGSKTTAFGTPMVIFSMWAGLFIMQSLYFLFTLIHYVWNLFKYT